MRNPRPALALGFVACMTIAACKDTVLSIVEVSTVQVSGVSGPVLVGVSVQLQAQPLDDQGNALRNRSVTWSTSNASVVTVDNTGRVTGVGAGSASVTATIEGKNGAASVDVHNPSPAVSATNPAIPIVGSAAFQLTVTGTGFVQASAVRWNGTARTTTYVNSTELRAAITASDVANVGSAQITVFNPAPGGGTSAPFSVTVGYAAPVVQSINPPADTMRAGAFQLTVTGTGFSTTSVVRWNGSDRSTTFVSTTTLRASITSSDLASPGYAQVTVFTPAPGGGTSGAVPFTVRVTTTSPRISGGLAHTCAVVSQNGGVLCWGQNGTGQLGDGTSTDRSSPVNVQGNIVFVAVVAGYYHSCGIDVVGLAWCWGWNGLGQLGDDSNTTRTAPTAVAGNRRFVALAAGGSSTCGIEVGGAAFCWGANNAGQLGDGTTSSRVNPTPVQGGRLFQSIEIGPVHACAVTTAGTPFCWGSGANGQLGNGANVNSPVPVQVQTATVFQSIDVGTYNSCARTAAGGASCWGHGGAGQLGTGNYNTTNVPVTMTGGPFTSLRMGTGHSCATTSGGSVFCWGSTQHGALGTGQVTTTVSSPVQVPGLPIMREVTSGDQHSCAVSTNGALYCWGNRGRGQLGTGTIAIRTTPVQVQSGAMGFATVSAGYEFSCGVRTNARVSCWGAGDYGQLGNGAQGSSPTPVDVSSAFSFSEVRTGLYHACALSNGAAHCWGEGFAGRLGNGASTISSVPVAVSGGHVFRSLDAGGSHTCGVTTANVAMCWGQNSLGQLGTGNTTNASVPTPVVGVAGVSFSQISTGANHTCALTSTATVYCWGWNGNGQLGDGTTTDRSSPVPIASLTNIVNVQAGYFHTCALTAAGSVHCWGSNGLGELGVPSSNNQLTPVQVPGTLVIRQISIGTQTTCTVDAANVARCWGGNLDGQFGNGAAGSSTSTPTGVSGGHSFSRIEVTVGHTCGVTTTGSAYCWGLGRAGEWGNGEVGVEPLPRQVTGVTLGPPLAASRAVRSR